MKFEYENKIYVIDSFQEYFLIEHMANEFIFLENFWTFRHFKLPINSTYEDELFLFPSHYFNENSPFADKIKKIDDDVKDAFHYLKLKNVSSPLIWCYQSGDFIPTHVDVCNNLLEYPRYKALIFLSDVNNCGGETVFHVNEYEKISIEPKIGRMIFFDSGIPHSVNCINRNFYKKRLILNYEYESLSKIPAL